MHPTADSQPPIRKRLRKWLDENHVDAPKPMVEDTSDAAGPRNVGTRPRGVDDSALERAVADSAADQHFLDRDGSLDLLLPSPSRLGAGDIFEYRDGGDRGGPPTIAICLGHMRGHYHFYTANGLWITSPGATTHFAFRNFASEAEMQPVIAKLPQGDLSLEAMREMSRQGKGPDRVAGAALLRKMGQFLQATDEMLQKYATQFEKAHEIVSEGDDKYLTLEHIKQRLLAKEDLMWPAPAHVLYAVHRTIFNDDVGFRVVGNLDKSSAPTWLFEVTPREDVSLIQNMQTLVRLFTDIPGRLNTPLSSLTASQLKQSQLGRFVVKSREAIDESRLYRDWTPYGMLGPAKKPRPRSALAWTGVDRSILHFMLLWAGYDQFGPFSRLHWIGSAILRATGRYKDVEYLSATTAWTFLQEIGYITPWDLHERYKQRVPGAKVSRESGFVPFQLGPEGIRPYLTQDVFDGKRHDWANLKAFAIDSKSTTDVDDAVSIEATNAPNEHWIHIHVADPASRIRHQNALGERASLTPLTLYLSGHYSNIWGVKNEVQELFSLAPNRSCLTFSGLLNDEGELLEYKITPAKLQNIICMTPEDANTAVDGSGASEQSTEAVDAGSFIVGKTPKEKPATRPLTTPSELPPADLASLKTLYRLAEARDQQRHAGGLTPKWRSDQNVDVFFDNTSIDHVSTGLMICNGDPDIQISWRHSESRMVSSIMVLAGEIAARWSADRNIPIPYLSQPESEKNRELLKTFVDKIYNPLLNSGADTSEHVVQLNALVGESELSTKPARHFYMGVDMYAKVTSPLRRYSDLLAHWQIENALVQEMETGKVAEQKLPFSRKALDHEILPWLRLRQQPLTRLGRHSGRQGYMLQALLRAWRYPAKTQSALPKTFQLTVTATHLAAGAAHRRKLIRGDLDWYRLNVWVVADGLGKLGLEVADVKKGDVLEVKLVDINVHLGEVYVEATGKVSVQKDREIEQQEVKACEG